MTEQLETEQKERGNLITERKKYLNLQMIITHNTANVILRNAPRIPRYKVENVSRNNYP